MSQYKTAERKFHAQRRLAQGGVKIKLHPKLLSSKPMLQSSGFFSRTKNIFLQAETYLFPDKSDIKSQLPVFNSKKFSGLMATILAFLPKINAESMTYFFINDSHYAVIPKGDAGWINGSCGAIIEQPTGVLGEEITSLCFSETHEWGAIFAGVNTTANMTSALECLRNSSQRKCEYESRVTLIALSIIGSMICLCCYLWVCSNDYRRVSGWQASRIRSGSDSLGSGSRVALADEQPSHEHYQQLVINSLPNPSNPNN